MPEKLGPRNPERKVLTSHMRALATAKVGQEKEMLEAICEKIGVAKDTPYEQLFKPTRLSHVSKIPVMPIHFLTLAHFILERDVTTYKDIAEFIGHGITELDAYRFAPYLPAAVSKRIQRNVARSEAGKKPTGPRRSRQKKKDHGLGG